MKPSQPRKDVEERLAFHDYASKLEAELDEGLSQENLFIHRGTLAQYAPDIELDDDWITWIRLDGTIIAQLDGLKKREVKSKKSRSKPPRSSKLLKPQARKQKYTDSSYLSSPPPRFLGSRSIQKSRQHSDQVDISADSNRGADSDEFLPPKERHTALTKSNKVSKYSSRRVTRSSLRYIPIVEIPYSPRKRSAPRFSGRIHSRQCTRINSSRAPPISTSNSTTPPSLLTGFASPKSPEAPQPLHPPLHSDEFALETAFHEWCGTTLRAVKHFANETSGTHASCSRGVENMIVSQRLLLEQEMKHLEMKHFDKKRSFLELVGQEWDRVLRRSPDGVDG